MADSHNTQYCNLQESAQAQQELDNDQETMETSELEEDTTTSNKVYGIGIPSPPQSPQRAYSPCVSLASIPDSPSDEASIKGLEGLEDPLYLLHNAQNTKVYDLVDFLVLNYQMKAFTTKAEMLESIGREYEEYYPLFLWGPRAFAETSKIKVLQFFASINKTHSRVYPEKYTEALRDEIDRTKA